MRELLDDLGERYDLHVYVRESDMEFVTEKYTVHNLSDYPRSPWFRLLTAIYEYTGALPTKEKYYIDYSQRKIDRISSRITRWRLELKLRLRRFFPLQLKYSRFLKWLARDYPSLSEYDVFFGVTDVVDDQLYADVIHQGIPFYIYIVSWDHPPKFTRFLQEEATYLVWGEEMANDMNIFHRVSLRNSLVVGAGQFNRLYEFIQEATNDTGGKPPTDYIYYIGTFGYDKLVKQELVVIKSTCELLRKIAPEIKVVFRPYPLLAKQGFYEELEKIDNLEFDSYSPVSRSTLFEVEDLEEKYHTIKNAKAVIHMGTTMGLEAALLDVPVVCFNGKAFDDKEVRLTSRLSTSYFQWHLSKYLLLDEFESVVNNYEALENVLVKILKGNYDYSYNEKLKSWVDVSGRSGFRKHFYDLIELSAQ